MACYGSGSQTFSPNSPLYDTIFCTPFLKAGNSGDNIIIPIPLVDRGRGDPRNIMGVILDRNENDMHRIAVRAGILKGSYSRK